MVVLSAVSLKCVLKHKRFSADNIVREGAKSTMSRFFLPHGATIPSGPGFPNYRGFTLTLIYTHQTRLDSSGRVTSPTQKSLPDNTQHSLETDIHAPGGIRSHNCCRQTASYPPLRLRSH